MRATSLFEVKNLANPMEAMLLKAYEALGGKSIIPRSSDVNDEEIWITPFFQRGRAAKHYFKRPDGNFDNDIWKDCLIGFDLSVPRKAFLEPALVVATYDLFAQEIARIELALDVSRQDINNGLLSFHHFTGPHGLGAPVGFDPERKEDRAEVRYMCDVGIKNDAWPLAGTAYTDLAK